MTGADCWTLTLLVGFESPRTFATWKHPALPAGLPGNGYLTPNSARAGTFIKDELGLQHLGRSL